MAGFSDETLEEIKARSDIVEIISQRVPLKRAGSDFKACCPFHHEKTPSFIVSPSRRTFHCFGCGVQGDVFKFLMLSDGMTFPDAVKALAERCGVRLEEEDGAGSSVRKRLLALHEDIAAFYVRCLEQLPDAQHARDYLARRKLDSETIARFRIGFAPARPGVLLRWADKRGYTLEEMVEGGFLSPPRSAGDSFYDKFKGRLMFPICDQSGRVVAFSGRILDESQKGPKYYNSTETPIFRKSRTLYGLCFAKKAITRDPRRNALICEGQIDVIRCHACGFANAVASQGTAFTAEHVSLLKAYADGATLLFDGDAAGIKAAVRTGRLFLAAGMPAMAVLLPDGEDPDSFLRDHPASEFQALLDNPVSLVALHVMAAKKQSSGGIESLDRLMGELFETFASASKSVMQSYMIQEAAELLDTPREAIEKDFAAYLEEQSRHRQWRPGAPAASRATLTAQQTQLTTEPSPAPSPAAEREETPQETRAEQGAPAVEPAAPAKLRLPETPLLAVAETLVKISANPSDENRGIAAFLSQWLPPVSGDTVAGAIVLAALADWKSEGSRALTSMAESGSGEERAAIAFLASRPSPVMQSSMPLIEAMQELVFRAWLDFARKTRDSIAPGDKDGPRRRLLVSAALRRLESAPDWQSRSDIIRQFL